MTIPAGTMISAGDLQYDNKNVTISGGTVTIGGRHTFCGLTLTNSSVLTHAPVDTQGVDVEVLTDCVIETGSRIDADRKGYGSAAGPGAGTSGRYGGGGGFGGRGGNGADSPGGASYGSMTEPTDLGSGGGSGSYVETPPGGAGGGRIRLTVLGALRVEGQISANGGPGSSFGGWAAGGGGSGGSICLTVGELAGGGQVMASGGVGGGTTGGGGGGGRIAIDYCASGFTGTLAATGGSGAQQGGAGTVYTKADDAPLGELDIANTGLPAGARTDCNGDSSLAANVRVRSGGVLGQVVGLTVIGDMNVEADGAISADRDGYGSASGPGAGTSGRYAGGGGYGGRGGNGADCSGGASYGSMTEPADLGSGGGLGWYAEGAPGGAGGGRIRLTVLGALHVDGQISANGGPGSSPPPGGWAASGGGSGGSIWLTVGELVGGGQIIANGGAGYSNIGGGGGGGRIAIGYCASGFTGTLAATGGSGAQQGGAGTVYTKADDAPLGELDIANTGLPAGARTDCNGDSSLAANVRVRSGGVLGQVVGLTVIGDVNVEADGAISADRDGYGSEAGPGAGTSGRYAGGGGYGGRGGNGADCSGGASYGSMTEPADLGSGGGERHLFRDGARGSRWWADSPDRAGCPSCGWANQCERWAWFESPRGAGPPVVVGPAGAFG